MTSSIPWNPHKVHLSKVSIIMTDDRYNPLYKRINEVRRQNNTARYEYHDNKSDEAILHSIKPSLVTLSEMTQATYDSDTLDIPIRRTFISRDRHNQLSADKILEMWCIGSN